MTLSSFILQIYIDSQNFYDFWRIYTYSNKMRKSAPFREMCVFWNFCAFEPSKWVNSQSSQFSRAFRKSILVLVPQVRGHFFFIFAKCPKWGGNSSFFLQLPRNVIHPMFNNNFLLFLLPVCASIHQDDQWRYQQKNS